MTLQAAIDEFLIEQQIRGNSPKTVRYYSVSLKRYSKYAAVRAQLADTTLATLRGYYLSLASETLSTASVQSYVRALRAFLSWCYSEGYLSANFSEKFRLPKAQAKVVDVLSDDEARRLLGGFDLRHATQLRNFCICALMLDSGLRLSEVVTLTLPNLRLSEGYAVVLGKGNKQRVVPLGLQSRKALTRYLRRRVPSEPTERVFLTGSGCPITVSTIALMFRKLKTTAAIPRLRAHLLRHTFATRYLECGGDMYSLQTILGHSSLEMVRRYVHFTPEKLQSTHRNHSPLDSLLKTMKPLK